MPVPPCSWCYILTRDTVRWRARGRYSAPLDEHDVRLRAQLHKKILGVQEAAVQCAIG